MDTTLNQFDSNPSKWVSLGRRWFQWRSLSPVPLFLLIIAMQPDFAWTENNQWALLLALISVVGGELIRLWAVGYAGSVTRTRGDKVPALVHAGPYRYVRNPLYIGNILLYTGCGVAFGFIWVSIIIFVYSLVQYNAIIAFEEELLTRTFGDPYRVYQSKVSRWIISLKPSIESTPQEFSLERAVRSERSTFVCIGAMILIFMLKQLFF